MKRIIHYLMLTFTALIIVSCTKSEDLLSIESTPDTRADSPLLLATPTELYFEDVEYYNTARDTVNIKTAGLASVIALTRLDITIQGRDKDKFGFIQPDLDLEDLLDALIGDGIDITVTYTRDFSAGPHEAELLVTASLLGVLLPLQITVPLHGITEIPIPKLVQTIPENEGYVEFEGKVPGVEYLDKGQYHLYFIFDRDITIANYAGIKLDGIPHASIRKREVINGNTLSVTIWDDAIYFAHRLVIMPNSIVAATNVTQTVGNEYIYLDFSPTGTIPDNYIEP